MLTSFVAAPFADSTACLPGRTTAKSGQRGVAIGTDTLSITNEHIDLLLLLLLLLAIELLAHLAFTLPLAYLTK
jgi:hypothetical protein